VTVGEGVSRLLGCPDLDAIFTAFFVPRDFKLIEILFKIGIRAGEV